MRNTSLLTSATTRRNALSLGLAGAVTFGIASTAFARSLAGAVEGKGKGGGGCDDCSGETESGHEAGSMGRGSSKGKRTGRTGVRHEILRPPNHGGSVSGVKGKVLSGHGMDEEGGHENEGR